MSSPSPILDSPTESQQPTDLLSPDSAKKRRRQTAFYPNLTNKPQKPFSRSAAKRESVMALGSIEHLQHYFTKTGFAAVQNPLSSKSKNNLVPALGPGILNTNLGQPRLGSDIILPPTPVLAPPLRPAFPPHVKNYQIDPELLKPSVIEDLEAVERVWCLGDISDTQTSPQDLDLPQASSSSQTSFDVLSVLKTTTRVIRSVRNYLVSLPDDFTAPRQAQTQFRPSTLSPPTGTPRKVAQPAGQVLNEPSALVRKSALEVLSVLRHVEETARIPLTDDVYEVQSDSGSTSTRSHTPGGTERVASPSTDDDESTASFSFSIVKVPSQKNEVLVWSDEENDNEEEEEKKERWDERLVLGGGWLYRQDMTIDQLSKEREAIGRYLDAVDALLFGGDGGQRGWKKEKERLAMDKTRSKGRRQSTGDGEGRSLGPGGGRGRRIVSAGMLDAMRNMVLSEEPEGMENVAEEAEEDHNEDSEASVEDDDLPDWAKRSKFVNEPLDRLMSLLITLLPNELIPLLPPPSDSSSSTLLLRLSSGQILCIAYNIAVRRSKKPWGYINKNSIHDIATLETQSEAVEETEREKRKVGWTFRRTDNLRLWAAALRLRYMLNVGPTPVQTKSSGTGGTSQCTTPVSSPSPSQQAFSIPSPLTTHVDNQFVRFDPQIVAKREEGWEIMLESAVLKWMWAVVAEKRSGTKS